MVPVRLSMFKNTPKLFFFFEEKTFLKVHLSSPTLQDNVYLFEGGMGAMVACGKWALQSEMCAVENNTCCADPCRHYAESVDLIRESCVLF